MSATPAVERLIDQYCAAWSDPDPARRRELLSGVWRADATYTDPRAHVSGIEQLLAHMDQIQARRPGARVVRTCAVDEHHGFVRFAWRAEQADGAVVLEGIYIAEVGSDGIRGILGFFGELSDR